jgi:threonine aldolase
VRYGGDLPLAFPMIISALDGLTNTLPLMADHHRQAIVLAAAIDQAPGVTAFPNPPHCNAFQVHFSASAEAMERAALGWARETGTWLFGRFDQGLSPDTCFGEVTVGEASMAWTADEATSALTELSRLAAAA